MKKPWCKYCGETGHYAFQCFKKAKAEYVLERESKPLGATLADKTIVKSTRRQNAHKRLIHELDKVTSEYVRKSRADKNGLAYCYTCGARLPWRQLDCGHFRSRRFIQTRFDLDNLRPQCQACNRYKHGNLEIYRQKLVRELGENKVIELETRPSRKLFEIELEQLVKERKKAIASLPKM